MIKASKLATLGVASRYVEVKSKRLRLHYIT